MSEDLHEKKIREMAKEIREMLSEDFIDETESNSLFIQIGDKTFELKPTNKSSDVEDLIKAEMKEKISDKLIQMGKNIAEKLQEMSQAIQRYKTELNDKISEYEEKINDASIMPDVNLDHARLGLSIVKGNRPGSIIYLVRGLYWPKTISLDDVERKIKSNLSRRMMTPVIFYIEVDNADIVMEVSTRKLGNLSYFPHYHQNEDGGDCWGTWHHPRKCSSPLDAIQIARKAERILENIDSYSTTTKKPVGLPRLDTIRNMVDNENERTKPTARVRRTGLDESLERSSEPVWEV